MDDKAFPAIAGMRPVIRTVAPYQPGKFIEDVQAELGLSDVIKIASNENPYGPYPHSLARMTQELQRLNQYPDSSFKELRSTLGRLHQVSPDCICVSHGAEGMLQTIGKCFIQEGDEVIIPAATYALYKEITKIMGGRVLDAPMLGESVDLGAIASRLGPKTKLVWLANPNNPTGTIVDKAAFLSLLDRMPPEAWVILDEAYAEFAEPSLLPDRVELIRQGRRLISVRTFSKAYGLAGARLGYAIAAEEVVTVLDTVSEPFNANRVAIAGGLAAINEDEASYHQAVGRLIKDRELTAERLTGLGLRVVPSQANFIMFETPYPASEVFDLMMRHGVIVRPCHGWGYDRMIRVSIGTPGQMDRFITAMAQVLESLQARNRDG